jgi:hypothetical protein
MSYALGNKKMAKIIKDTCLYVRRIKHEIYMSWTTTADWNIATILPIHNKGGRKDPNNCRGITF